MPRRAPPNAFRSLPLHEKIEEETTALYDPKRFYPVNLGDVFLSRYQVLAKLGFGVSSTIWLCRDLQNNEYLTLKVSITGLNANAARNEIAISEHIRRCSARTTHSGQRFLRTVVGHFEIEGPHGKHKCLLFKPLGINLARYQALCPGGVVSQHHLKQMLRCIITAVDFLHKAGVVHTDLTTNNILMTDDTGTVFSEIERRVRENPPARKVLPDRTIYETMAIPRTIGLPVVCDFGLSRVGVSNTPDIMPYSFRAPEVILGMVSDNKIDIWSIGMIIWVLFEGIMPFKFKHHGVVDNDCHLAHMVSLMGPPPRSFLERSPQCGQYWDQQGRWIGRTRIPIDTFELKEKRLSGQDKVSLLKFVRRIFRWLPEERASAADLLRDEFLRHAPQ